VKLRSDQDPPQLDDHVDVGRAGLGGVPGRPVAAVTGDGGGVPGQVVPDDDDALGEQRKRDGPLDGPGNAVAAWPAPVMFLASLIATSMAHRPA
jgi:hypothetical protein